MIEEKKPRTRTVYVSADDNEVWEKAKLYMGGSLSQFITGKLREFVTTKEAEVGGKERIVVRFTADAIPHAQAFYGRWLIPPREAYQGGVSNEKPGSSKYYAVALTAKNKIVVFNFVAFIPRESDIENYPLGKLYVFESVDQIRNCQNIPVGLIAGIKAQMGVEVEELDI